jgi:hypothetical protein
MSFGETFRYRFSNFSRRFGGITTGAFRAGWALGVAAWLGAALAGGFSRDALAFAGAPATGDSAAPGCADFVRFRITNPTVATPNPRSVMTIRSA